MNKKRYLMLIFFISITFLSPFIITESEDCDCDLSEFINQTEFQALNASITFMNETLEAALLNFESLNNSYLVSLNAIEQLQDSNEILNDSINDINVLLSEFGDLNDSIIEIENTIESLNSSYNAMLNNYNILLANFTNYVNLLNSFGNITALINSININIAGIQSNVSTLQLQITTINSKIIGIQSNVTTLQSDLLSLTSRVTALENVKPSISPIFITYLNGFTQGGYFTQCFYVAHSDLDARIEATFHVAVSGTYKVVIAHTTDTSSRTDDGLIYVAKMAAGAQGSSTNVLNGVNFDLVGTTLQYIYQSSHSTGSNFAVTAGDMVFVVWIKAAENEGSGNFYSYGMFLRKV